MSHTLLGYAMSTTLPPPPPPTGYPTHLTYTTHGKRVSTPEMDVRSSERNTHPFGETNACENITFPQRRLRVVVINIFKGFMLSWLSRPKAYHSKLTQPSTHRHVPFLDEPQLPESRSSSRGRTLPSSSPCELFHHFLSVSHLFLWRTKSNFYSKFRRKKFQRYKNNLYFKVIRSQG